MSLSVTNWLNNLSNEPTEEQTLPCESKKNDCLQVLQEIQYILDGEATDEQQQHFESHVESCMPCFQQYNLDKSIKLAIQSKIAQKNIPVGLMEDIKLKIHNLI